MKKGSVVICIAEGIWFDTRTGAPSFGPDKDDIDTMTGHYSDDYIMLERFPGLDQNGTPISFRKSCFREIIPPADTQMEAFITKPKAHENKETTSPQRNGVH